MLKIFAPTLPWCTVFALGVSAARLLTVSTAGYLEAAAGPAPASPAAPGGSACSRGSSAPSGPRHCLHSAHARTSHASFLRDDQTSSYLQSDCSASCPERRLVDLPAQCAPRCWRTLQQENVKTGVMVSWCHGVTEQKTRQGKLLRLVLVLELLLYLRQDHVALVLRDSVNICRVMRGPMLM